MRNVQYMQRVYEIIVNFSLSCSFSSFESSYSDELESGEGVIETVDPYQFEPEVSDSDSDSDNGDDHDSQIVTLAGCMEENQVKKGLDW